MNRIIELLVVVLMLGGCGTDTERIPLTEFCDMYASIACDAKIRCEDLWFQCSQSDERTRCFDMFGNPLPSTGSVDSIEAINCLSGLVDWDCGEWSWPMACLRW